MDLKRFLYNLKLKYLKRDSSNLNNALFENFYFGVGFINLTLERSGLFVMLPENFNLNNHIANFPPESNGFTTALKGFDKDKAYHLLGLLSSIPARNKDLIVEDGYIPLNAAALNMYITDYNSYLEYLRNTNVIEWKNDGEYFEGKSRRYRWTNRYINSKFIRVEMPKFNRLRENKKTITLAEFLSLKSEQEQYLANYPYLIYWYSQNKLKIDINKAENYASSIRDYKLAQGSNSWDWNKDKDEYKNPSNQYAAILENIHSIDFNHDYKVQIDEHVHRLHSVLTNMQKEFRNFLNYDGKQLVSIDIKNSQPYLSCALFNPNFWTENSSLILNLNQLPSNIINSIRFTPPKESSVSIITALNNFFRKLEGHEFDAYKSIVSSGIMYETIKRWVQEEKGQSISRDEAKTTMFRLFFSSNRENRDDENHWLITYYKSKFPQVAELFKIIKKQFQGLNEEKQHGRLACLLQSIESEIILHRCCKRIWEEKNHQVPVFTIHDSIATTIENREYVKGIMEDELTKAIGITPKLSEEIWDDRELMTEYDKIELYLRTLKQFENIL